MDTLGFDLILLGAPAAGKDTQAQILRQRYKLRPVESGKHWRRMAAKQNATGELLRKTFSKGNMTPVKLMKEFLVGELRRAPKGRDLIFIGNPRLKPEAQLLVKLLTAKRRNFLAIFIDLPASVIRERSLKRRRDDQDWKYVDHRVKMHRLQVSKTSNYFKSLNKLKTVNGNRSIEKVARDIGKIINDYQRSQTNRHSPAKR